MAENNWDDGVANLEALAGQFKDIERRALKAVNEVIVPRLKAAAPLRVSSSQRGNSLPNGAFRTNCRGRVHVGKGGDDPSRATADFGDISWIAHIVDIGHNAPYERALSKAGVKSRAITHKPTPAHPFVRSVQDSTAAAAQEAYESAMQAEIEKALSGN